MLLPRVKIVVVLPIDILHVDSGALRQGQAKRRMEAEVHGLSAEAVLTLIGVCVAVFGVGLTLALKWDSLKKMCLARCCRHRARLRRNAMGKLMDDSCWNVLRY
jgi:hypothetical protein